MLPFPVYEYILEEKEEASEETEVIEPGAHQRFQLGEGMDVQRCRAAQEPERRDEPHQSEAVVAMQMRDEDMPQTRKAQSRPAVLALRALATVNHIELVAQVDDLRRGVVARGGECRTAPEDMNFKLLHLHSSLGATKVAIILKTAKITP